MYRQIARNKLFSILLIALFCLAVLGLGAFTAWFFGELWPLWAIVVLTPLYVWWELHRATASAAEATGWVPVEASDEPRLVGAVETAAIRVGIAAPRVGVIEDAAANAFTASMRPDDAIIGVTRGALDLLDDSELDAVIAHEVAHVVNQDGRVTLTMFALVGSIASIAGVLIVAGWGMVRSLIEQFRFGLGIVIAAAGALLLALGLVFGLVAFVIGPLISSAVSKRREHLADATAVEQTRYPDALASALQKIEAHGATLTRPQVEASGLFFVSPVGEGWLARLLGTHPPVAERVARVQAMGHGF